jgi:hypothetical protein
VNSNEVTAEHGFDVVHFDFVGGGVLKNQVVIDQVKNPIFIGMFQNRNNPAKDGQGLTVKDHLIHLIFWERSVVFFLQGLPRHTGPGVEKTLSLLFAGGAR